MSDLFGNHIVGFPTRRLIFPEQAEHNTAHLWLVSLLILIYIPINSYGHIETGPRFQVSLEIPGLHTMPVA